jgi:hypothetical protein
VGPTIGDMVVEAWANMSTNILQLPCSLNSKLVVETRIIESVELDEHFLVIPMVTLPRWTLVGCHGGFVCVWLRPDIHPLARTTSRGLLSASNRTSS